MADIILTCPACKATLKLSEYAKPDHLACPSCQTPLTMPDTRPAQASDRLLPQSVRDARAAAAARTAQPDQPEPDLLEVVTSIHSRRRKRRVRTESVRPVLLTFLLFLALGGALIYLRYFKGYTHFLPESDLDLLRAGGAIALLFFHLVIVVEAFTSDFLTGLFCLAIPGYSLYYLFGESDSFALRAIVLALLAAFGLDFVLFAKGYALQTYDFINAWLEAGGEI